MRKIVAAVGVLVLGLSFVAADEFGGKITKVDGNKITLTKRVKKGEKGEEVTLTAVDNVKVVKGKFNKEDKKVEAGEALEGGLKNEAFRKDVAARIITNDDGKITEIRVFEFRKKKDTN